MKSGRSDDPVDEIDWLSAKSICTKKWNMHKKYVMYLYKDITLTCNDSSFFAFILVASVAIAGHWGYDLGVV